MNQKLVTLAAVACVTLVTGSASAAQILLGQASGGVGVYYNSTGSENPANQAYMKVQASMTSLLGAAFAFEPAYAGPLAFNDLGQYKFDMVVENALTSDNSVTVPTLQSVDRNYPGAPIVGGDIDWTLDNTQGGTIVQTHLYGGNGDGSSLLNPTFTLTGGAGFWTMDFSVDLVSDGFYHWYYGQTTPLGPQFTDVLTLTGTLVYDQNLDVAGNRMDFYSTSGQGATTMKLYANSVPDAGSTLAMLGLVGCGLAAFRRRFVK